MYAVVAGNAMITAIGYATFGNTFYISVSFLDGVCAAVGGQSSTDPTH